MPRSGVLNRVVTRHEKRCSGRQRVRSTAFRRAGFDARQESRRHTAEEPHLDDGSSRQARQRGCAGRGTSRRTFHDPEPGADRAGASRLRGGCRRTTRARGFADAPARHPVSQGPRRLHPDRPRAGQGQGREKRRRQGQKGGRRIRDGLSVDPARSGTAGRHAGRIEGQGVLRRLRDAGEAARQGRCPRGRTGGEYERPLAAEHAVALSALLLERGARRAAHQRARARRHVLHDERVRPGRAESCVRDALVARDRRVDRDAV